ncbi:hypothetical protein DYE50_01930 [Treponema ruminis]|uniref:Putative repeat protein (TIGR02543 family) n=1 Tax=Treponema ruminis TaxID=744515 RepID=A0A7W8GAS8_9SPIR|nr:InlB B-repeat-containing protein [Treponema ruminis]MBB5226915.1 putative repeat protein (TIGR02543 family) [Treponema ruminis]QSI01342.1 hypothetical protein DYE50_01930 [Treponema ruminis]
MKNKNFYICLVSILYLVSLFISCTNPFYIKASGLYEVSFVTNGGTELETIRTTCIKELPVSEKEDCILEGWYDNASFSGSPVSFPFETENDTTLYAKWKKIVFTVSFETNCETELAPYKANCVKTSPVVSKADYILVGWFTSSDFKGTPVSFPYTLSADTKLYAKWAQSVFTVTFETNCDAEIAAYKTDIIEAVADISKEDYVLVGWYTSSDFNGTPISFPYSLTSDTTLYAKWAQSVFTVKFVTNCDVEIAPYKTDSITSAPIIERKGYEIVGWYTTQNFSGKAITFPYSVTKNTTLYAKWKEAAFLVNFETNGGSEISAYTTSRIESAPITSRDNYIFDGWYINPDFKGTAISYPFPITQNITLYAKWIKKTEVTVIFYDDTKKIKISIDDKEERQLKISASEGFESYKWICDDTVLSNDSNCITLTNLSAGYHLITVTVQDNDGKTVSSYIKIRKTE